MLFFSFFRVCVSTLWEILICQPTYCKGPKTIDRQADSNPQNAKQFSKCIYTSGFILGFRLNNKRLESFRVSFCLLGFVCCSFFFFGFLGFVFPPFEKFCYTSRRIVKAPRHLIDKQTATQRTQSNSLNVFIFRVSPLVSG